MKAAQRYAQDYASADYRGAYQDYMMGRGQDLGTLGAYTGATQFQLGVGERSAQYLSGAYTGFGGQMGGAEMRLGDINASVHLAQSEAAATGAENYMGSARGSSGTSMLGSQGSGVGGGGGGGGGPMSSGLAGQSWGGGGGSTYTGSNMQSNAGGMAALSGGMAGF